MWRTEVKSMDWISNWRDKNTYLWVKNAKQNVQKHKYGLKVKVRIKNF